VLLRGGESKGGGLGVILSRDDFRLSSLSFPHF
jgi:hypothetical protein